MNIFLVTFNEHYIEVMKMNVNNDKLVLVFLSFIIKKKKKKKIEDGMIGLLLNNDFYLIHKNDEIYGGVQEW